MKSLTFRKLSILGLVLMVTSAVTAALLPNDNSKKAFNGVMIDSTDGCLECAGQISCINASGVKNCTYTAEKTDTTGGHGTSVLNIGSSAGTCGGHLNSSKSPC